MLVDELGPFDKGVHHLVLGNDHDVLALHEQVAALVARGNAEIGIAGFSRPVHDTAHHGDLQRDLPLTEGGHRVLGNGVDVDFGATTRRTRDQVDVLALTQAHSLKQLTAGLGFLDLVGSE